MVRDALSKFHHEALSDIQKQLASEAASHSAGLRAGIQETLAAIHALPDMSADIAKLARSVDELVLGMEPY